MGMFDEIKIGGRTYQTKALGNALTVYRPGDPVTMTESAGGHQLPPTYTFDAADYPNWTRVEVIMLVDDGVLVGVTGTENPFHLDYHGHRPCDRIDIAQTGEQPC